MDRRELRDRIDQDITARRRLLGVAAVAWVLLSAAVLVLALRLTAQVDRLELRVQVLQEQIVQLEDQVRELGGDPITGG